MVRVWTPPLEAPSVQCSITITTLRSKFEFSFVAPIHFLQTYFVEKLITHQALCHLSCVIMSVIDLSCIPVNKGTNSRLEWTKYSDLYETVHPSLVLISLCLLTGV